ncbi:MAG TPA: response regulator [Acetobacteraceae bacterium]
MDKRLAGLRVLVVEDEAIIAMLLEDMLADFGCEVVGVVPAIEPALAVVRDRPVDGALLDMNIHGESTVPVAEELASRAIPFLLVTGYGDRDNDPPVIKAAPRLKKPFSQDELARRMAEAFIAR